MVDFTNWGIKRGNIMADLTKSQIYTNFRKQIYASINGTKGNLTKLSKSNILSKREKELLSKVIDNMEELRVEYYNNRGNRVEPQPGKE